MTTRAIPNTDPKKDLRVIWSGDGKTIVSDQRNRGVAISCNFCGTFDVYVDTSHIDYNSRDSWPILRNTSDNEPHHCVNMKVAGVWR